MFDNVKIKSGIDKDGGSCCIYVSWRWIFDNISSKPECNVFCFGVDQDLLLSDFIFREREIINWFREKYVDFTSENKEELLKSFRNNPQNSQSCQLLHVALNEGGNINHTQTLRFLISEQNKVFLVCVYDEHKIVPMIVAINSGDQIGFDINFKKTRLVFGEKYAKLENITGEYRQKVLVVQTGRTTTYSMIPQGTESYFLNSEFLSIDKASVQVKYLSDFI